MGCEMDILCTFIDFPIHIFSKIEHIKILEDFFCNVGKIKEDVWYGNN